VGIEDYLKERGLNAAITISELNHIVEKVYAKTSLSKEESIQIVKLFFDEIRAGMINKEIIKVSKLGSFFISCPSVTNNKERVFAKFKPNKSFIKRMNDE